MTEKVGSNKTAASRD